MSTKRSATAAIAQLAARRSHNPKVVSSILTRRILFITVRRDGVDISVTSVDIFCNAAVEEAVVGIEAVVVLQITLQKQGLNHCWVHRRNC